MNWASSSRTKPKIKHQLFLLSLMYFLKTYHNEMVHGIEVGVAIIHTYRVDRESEAIGSSFYVDGRFQWSDNRREFSARRGISRTRRTRSTRRRHRLWPIWKINTPCIQDDQHNQNSVPNFRGSKTVSDNTKVDKLFFVWGGRLATGPIYE